MVLTVGELAEALQARAWGDLALPVSSAAEPGATGEGVIALAMAPKYAAKLRAGDMAILAEGIDP